MNLLAKLQKKLKGAPVDKTTGHSKGLATLNKLPSSEKVKVLGYLKSVNKLDK